MYHKNIKTFTILEDIPQYGLQIIVSTTIYPHGLGSPAHLCGEKELLAVPEGNDLIMCAMNK
jgi:hypothetical protein